MKKLRIPALMVLMVICLALGPTGCLKRDEVPVTPVPTVTPEPTAAPEPTPEPTPTTEEPTPTTPAAKLPVQVWLTAGEHIYVVGRRVDVKRPASDAMTELLKGPNSAEKAKSIKTAIPAGTKVLGLKIADGLATVDLSGEFESGGGTLSMSMRIAQVVATLTQFPSVNRVAFKLDGKRIDSIGGEGIIVSPSTTLKSYEDVLPAILVRHPVPGQTVPRTVRLSGTSNTFEATMRVRVVDSKGKTLAEKSLMATSGSGTRGTFASSITYPAGHPGPGRIVFFESSAKDGTEINVVEIPVTLK